MQREDTLDQFLGSCIFEKGFIIPEGLDAPPPSQLGPPYEIWEDALLAANELGLHIADTSPLAEHWRQRFWSMPILPVSSIIKNTGRLLCARRILVFLMHLYIHSIPETDSRIVPAAIATPLLIISRALDMPPVVTFADTEFYNFAICELSRPPAPDSELRILSVFSGTPDERHFYVTGLIVELEGVYALRLMRRAIEVLHQRQAATEPSPTVALLLTQLATQIQRMAVALDAVRLGCDPKIYYDGVRLWFNGNSGTPPWKFAVVDSEDERENESLRTALQDNRWIRQVQDGHAEATEMAGASAAQSSIVQALDAFLGIAEETHETEHGRGNFLEAMRAYMPRDHRDFIVRLAEEGAMLRRCIAKEADGGAKKAYNEAIDALRHFRTVHIKIATMYIVNPRARTGRSSGTCGTVNAQSIDRRIDTPPLGTGGTAAIPFLKRIRNWTADASL